MGGIIKKGLDTAGQMAATAVAGPIGAAAYGFGKKALSGGNFYESLGGAASGAANSYAGDLGSSPGSIGSKLPSANLNAGGSFLTKVPSANGLPGATSFRDLAYQAPKVSLLDTLRGRSPQGSFSLFN